MNRRKTHDPRIWPRLSHRLISIAIALFPIVLFGAIESWNNAGTKVEDWLPAGFAETKQLMTFFHRFGSDELLMIGWEGAKLGDETLGTMREALLSADQTDPEKRVFFRDVWTGDSVLAEMQSPPLNLTPSQAKTRMAGWILGKDHATAVLALVSDAGMADRHAAVGFARRITSHST